MRTATIAVLPAVIFVCSLCAAQGPRIGSVSGPNGPVPQFEKAEFLLDVQGKWENPFDPEQIDVTAHFTSPSGRQIHVPAFFHQPCRARMLSPEERRRQVSVLKFFINESEWAQKSDIAFFLDDVRLSSSVSGKELLIDDMEGDDVRRSGPKGGVEPATDVVHSGKRALRFKPQIEGKEDWPGVAWAFDKADWSSYDKASLWLYPKTSGFRGPVHLYFRDERFGNSPIERWDLSAGDLKLNAWNRLEWDWRGFRRQIAFEKEGAPKWAVRFAPAETGRYAFYITAKDKSGESRSEAGSFEAVPSENPGFVRVSKKAHHYFEFDKGTPFFTIGHDVPADLNDALEYFPKMQAVGENCTYVIMYPNRLAIEWKKLGWYDQEAAAALDRYVDCAKEHGIYFKLSFDEHCVNRPSRDWGKNPYNAVNGGPCKEVNDFFTSAEARKLYKNRLRYILARWGYSTNIMAWEYFAEIDGATSLKGKEGWRYPYLDGGDEISAMLAVWIREMSKFLKDNDPFNRLITESFGGGVSDPKIWEMPEIEYTQIHEYNVPDAAGALSDWCLKLTKEYPKPMLVTEFGWNTKNIDNRTDPTGLCLHNGIWASVASGSAGTAMTWWCKRVDDLDLYHHFRALANFAAGIHWTDEDFKPVEARVQLPNPDHYVDVTVQAAGPFSGATVSKFIIGRDGAVNDPKQVPQTLLARGRKEPRTVPEFEVDYPQAGKFLIHVDSVSPDARLEVYVDGKLALRKELPAQNVADKASVFDAQWQVWRCVYDEDFGVDVPPGKHTIRIENTHEAGSWIKIDGYRLTNYGPPGLRALGLAGRTISFLWIQNKESTWWNDKAGLKPKPVSRATANVSVPEDGDYSVEWWDTYKGIATQTERLEAKDGTLVISVPPLERDVACKIRRATAP